MRGTYTASENSTWQLLTAKRRKSLPEQACKMYLQGLENLQLPTSHIPTPTEINNAIQPFARWQMVPRTESVGPVDFFRMLADCRFPAGATVRPCHEIDYYSNSDPDVIHDYFGHGPFLTVALFARFMQRLAQVATSHPLPHQVLLARLFWFTIEFGLIRTQEGLRVYGAGIIPSEAETRHALYGDHVERREFNLLDVLRTPFSATNKQTIYYVISSFEQLFSLSDREISAALSRVSA